MPEVNHLILDGIDARNEGRVEEGATVVGRVRIGKGSVISGRSVVRGPSIIGWDCNIGPSAHIGPYKAIGNRCVITVVEIDDSIVMGDAVVNVVRKIVDSMIGKGSKTSNSNGKLLKGGRLVVGENATT